MQKKTLQERIIDARETEWHSMKRRMDAARRLEPGKWYTLYQYVGTKAVTLNRKCAGHYANFALFEDKRGMRHSYTYAELAQMIQAPPQGCIVISEKQARSEEF